MWTTPKYTSKVQFLFLRKVQMIS